MARKKRKAARAIPAGTHWKTVAGRPILLKKDGTIVGGRVPEHWQGQKLQEEPWRQGTLFPSPYKKKRKRKTKTKKKTR